MKFLKYINMTFMLCLSVLACVACSGSSDDSEDTPVVEGELHISADKTDIQANGTDKVTFTVKYGSQDVSTNQNMNLVVVNADGSESKLGNGANSFSTTVAGTYSMLPIIIKELRKVRKPLPLQRQVVYSQSTNM
ncbi:hypothetical protein [uncultured Bacteroides sp.]|uniref:hypothetical protein n=1 Tax=uncultured Bacteroides sp. TaxID=162156 RepID=UPI00260D4F83|nr:hypothetical protein [uncultured Bacteroides sp.]